MPSQSTPLFLVAIITLFFILNPAFLLGVSASPAPAPQFGRPLFHALDYQPTSFSINAVPSSVAAHSAAATDVPSSASPAANAASDVPEASGTQPVDAAPAASASSETSDGKLKSGASSGRLSLAGTKLTLALFVSAVYIAL